MVDVMWEAGACCFDALLSCCLIMIDDGPAKWHDGQTSGINHRCDGNKIEGFPVIKVLNTK